MEDKMENIWAEIEGIIKHSNKKIYIFDGNYEKGKKECNELHIPLSSVLGSVVLHSNGIIIDNWIRIFGQDSSSNFGVFHYNGEKTYSNKIRACNILSGFTNLPKIRNACNTTNAGN